MYQLNNDKQLELMTNTIVKGILLDAFLQSTGTITQINDDVLFSFNVDFDLEEHPWFYEIAGVTKDQETVKFTVTLGYTDGETQFIEIETMNNGFATSVKDFIVVANPALIQKQIKQYLVHAYVTPDKFSFIIHIGLCSVVNKYDMPNAEHVTITNLNEENK